MLKVFSGIVMTWVYTHYYTSRQTADTFKYFDDSKILFEALFTHPSHFFQMLTGFHADADYLFPYYDSMISWYNKVTPYNDNRTVIRLNALMRFFSNGYYQVHNVFFCFLSFAGLTALLKVFIQELPARKKQLFVAVFLLPSVLFWGSGVLKDGFIFFVLGFALYFYSLFLKNQSKAKYFLLSVFFILLLWITKFHICLAAFPGFVALYLVRSNHRFIWAKFAVVYFILFLLVINAYRIFPQYNFLSFLVEKQKQFIELASVSQAGSAIQLSQLEPSVTGVIRNMPEALVNTFFRPHILEAKSSLMILSAIENAFIVLSMVICMVTIDRSLLNKPLIIFSVFYILSLFISIGLVTTVLGAVVRYRTQGLPFLFFIFIAISDKNKLLKILPFLKRVLND